MCKQLDLYKRYREFLEKLARTNSSELFTNGGKDYASILMSVLLDNTDKKARIFCIGFRPELVCTDDYKNSLERFLRNSGKEIRILVETDEYIHDSAVKILSDANHKDIHASVGIKLISEEDRERLMDEIGGGHCNFAVYDDNKYRMEYDPDNFKAFGSFNDKETSARLIQLFDQAYEKAEDLSMRI